MLSVTSRGPVKIDRLVPGGQGIGTLENGQKIFLWNALPGETVTEFTVTKKKSKYLEGIAEKITDENPHRITPRDDCYLSTSPFQIMDYNYELEQKSLLLQEAFRQVGLDTPQTEVQTDFNDYGYRNKMEYSLYFDLADERIHLAFHQRGSHRKIPIRTSSIERSEIFKKAQEIVNDLNAKHEEARKYQSLLLRCNQNGEISGGLYENGKPHPVFKNLTDKILDQTYSYSPNGFFQINLPVYEMALEEIKKHITTDKILDLYAGVGTIGLSVARDKDLTLAEVDKAAYAELERNAGNAKTFLGKSEELLDLIQPDQTVIIDPPRAGCDRKLLDHFLKIQPKTIIYLSCNPATQARDLKILTETRKYEITKIVPYNFFPRTPHLENLVILNVL